MNTKEGFLAKYLIRLKILLNFLYKRLFYICILLTLFIFSFFIALLFYTVLNISSSLAKYFSLQSLRNYIYILICIVCGGFILKLLLGCLLSFLYWIILRIENHTLSKQDFSAFINSQKDYHKMIVQTFFVKIIKILQLISRIMPGIIILITWFPLINSIINSRNNQNAPFPLTEWYYIILFLLVITFFPAFTCWLMIYWANRDYQKTTTDCLREPSVYNSLAGINFDYLSGTDFEKFCSTLLSYLGYKNIVLTPASHDQGVDIVAEKSNCRYAIQCKRYRYHVGNSAIQEAVAGIRMYNCQKAMVITNSYFTPAAISLARANQVELVDRNKLIKMLQSTASV